jgi:hypothetical protein
MMGLPWTLSSDPILKLAIAALFKRHPQRERGLKVPLTLSLLLRMMATLKGWPHPKSMSLLDIAFTAASAMAFFAALRGGELFTYKGSDRPILQSQWVTIDAAGVHIKVPRPKTKQRLEFQPAFAPSFPTASLRSLDAKAWLVAYRSESAERGKPVEPQHPVFSLEHGEPLTRDFMVHRSMGILKSLKIKTLGMDASPVEVKAASWRCGFVASALAERVPEATIRAAGRWESQGGMLAYSLVEQADLQSVARALVARATSDRSAGALGCSSSEQLLLRVQ